MTLGEQLFWDLQRLVFLFRQVEWQAGYPQGLTPLQRQLLEFIRRHPTKARPALMARHLGTQKPTISLGLRLLIRKGYVALEKLDRDKRGRLARLTPAGQALVDQITFSSLESALAQLEPQQQAAIHEALYRLLVHFYRTGLIPVANMCATCRFYQAEPAFCQHLQMALLPAMHRSDCPDHQPMPESSAASEAK